MSRAYCLTCNELVIETAGGTCPHGHPVSQEERGPEPWVGFAAVGSRPEGRTSERTAAAPSTNGTTGPQGNGHVNGHAGPESTVNGHRLDLEALADFELDLPPAAPPSVPAPTTDPRDVPAARETPDAGAGSDHEAASWDELATLAAELQLGGPEEPGPAPAPRAEDAPARPHDRPVDPMDLGGFDGLDELDGVLDGLGQLDSSPDDVVPPPAPAEPVDQLPPPPAPAPPTPAAPPPPPAPVAPDPAPPAAHTGFTEATEDLAAVWSEEPHDVPSDLPSTFDEVAPAAPVEPTVDDAPAATTSVDLTNFTARGNRVGQGGGGSGKRWRRKT